MKTVAQPEIEIFFDGECPLCRREIDWLRRRDRQSVVQFTDIASPTFEPGQYGKSLAQFMAQMHGRLPDGTWTTGVETFQRLYQILGLGWMIGWTRLPVLSSLANIAYRVFAANRLRLTPWHRRSTASCRLDGNCPTKQS